MLNRVINVDFSRKTGRIKPVNGINGGPRSGGYGLPLDMSAEFSEMAIPVARISGPSGEYGQNQFVNIHCIFPDFSRDPEDIDAYNFLPTDLYLSSVKSTGAEIFLRLGESAEPYVKKLWIFAPEDKEKWASICEHIIMHYNEGFASGFKFGIKYVEIWSGADRADGFASPKEEFFELYRITASRLRERFPKLKIGAYGAGGFYSLNRLDASEEEKSYIPFMQKFFAYVNNELTKAPLDFFSWSCHTQSPDELAMHIKYARGYLDAAGLKKTKSIICDYNSLRKGTVPIALRPDFPSELCSVLILAQKSNVDMMMYSTSDAASVDNGLFSFDDFITPHHYAAYNVMCAFGELARLSVSYETTGDYRRELYSLASANSDEGRVLIVTREYAGKVELSLKNSDFKTCTVSKISPQGERGSAIVYKAENIAISGDRIIIPTKKNEIYTVSLFK